jgi:hypothetical protein
MSDPAFKTYADRYFLTKKEHDRRLQATLKGVATAIGDILKPQIDRIAELEAQVAALQSTLAGMRQPTKARP